ncbi:MAG: hypothetical protein QM754_07445 [Tepidisphaeraceae bacterium]
MKRRPNSAGRFRQLLRRETVTRLTIGEWRCRFVNAPKAVEYSTASSLLITAEDWRREWPRLVEAYRADSLDVLKRDASGDVSAATISLAGVPVDVVLKRPLEKYWYRKLTSVWRPSRRCAPGRKRGWFAFEASPSRCRWRCSNGDGLACPWRRSLSSNVCRAKRLKKSN